MPMAVGGGDKTNKLLIFLGLLYISKQERLYIT
jgi:hypothetical protein